MDITQRAIDPAQDQALACAPAIAPIQALQAFMAVQPEQIKLAVRHHFTAGLYARELTVPAGVMLVGALHRTQHLFVLLQGTIIVNDGSGPREVSAPSISETQPGIKRAIHALTDARLVTFHVTEETDLAKIEAAVCVPEPDLPSAAEVVR